MDSDDRLAIIGGSARTPSFRRPPEALEMPVETIEFLLLLSGWIVAFLLGKELQTGFRIWRTRAAEQRADDREG